MRTLVLVRHGKAERGGANRPDADRSLTEGGRAALAGPEGFARTLARLSEKDRADAELWASPALRTRQTAAEAARIIGERPVAEHPCLWEQDLSGFLSEIEASPARVVVAVGHIPFMDEAVACLTGEPVAFMPGSVAAVEIPDGFSAADALGAGRLLWFEAGPAA